MAILPSPGGEPWPSSVSGWPGQPGEGRKACRQEDPLYGEKASRQAWAFPSGRQERRDASV